MEGILLNRQSFDRDLKLLKDKLLEMGGMVEKALTDSIASLKELNQDMANRVVEEDEKINDFEHEIESAAIHLIATQQPVAKDLRKIISFIKIAGDLERMGDFAVNIARVTRRLEGEKLIKPLVDIPQMAETAAKMVNVGLNAYIDENVDLAYTLDDMDDQVDAYYKRIMNELFEIMAKDPSTINQAIQLAFVGRYIERIGDHATNIGESVIYLVQGKKPDLNT